MAYIFSLAKKLFLLTYGAQGYAEEFNLSNLDVKVTQELLAKDKNVVVLDVRRSEKYALGHI